MPENNSTTPSPSPIPNASESFGKVPKNTESFETFPNSSENFRNVPKGSERKENHTLTVREVARMFEAAGVARTERSITNWCQPNKSGIARLDAYFDPNERKFYITPQSVEQAVSEEKAKAIKGGEHSEEGRNIPKTEENPNPRANRIADDSGRVKMLEQEVVDLRITNKAKDYFIGQLQKEREGLIDQVVGFSRQVGQLETQIGQLSGPRNDKDTSTLQVNESNDG